MSLAAKALTLGTNTWALSNSYVFYFVSTLLYLTNSILTNLSKNNFSGKAIELLYIEWHMYKYHIYLATIKTQNHQLKNFQIHT